MDKVKEYFEGVKGKRVAFLGLGISHIPLIKKYCAYGARVTACDMRSMEQLGADIDEIRGLDVEYHLGEDYLKGLEKFDIVFRTPGIKYFLPEIQAAVSSGVKVTSEIEMFFELCPCKIIGITGSDGKTTTTTVISEILAKQGYTVHKGGNIGIPLFPIIESVKPEDIAVVELSSFQLISMKDSPQVAVVTNVTPNHLNVHKDYQEYIDAKRNLVIHQSDNSRTVLNADNDVTSGVFKKDVKGELLEFSTREIPQKGAFWDKKTGEIIFNDNGKKTVIMNRKDIKLVGDHNVENYLAAICAVRGLVDDESIVCVARTFGGVEHRMELCRELGGVKFYNDSIASSPNRTKAGLLAYNQKIILIVGGKNKGLNYDELGTIINDKVKYLICMGDTGPMIKECTMKAANYDSEKIGIFEVEDMEQAVNKAYSLAESGDVVALSPASTSFDKYRNFEYRGRDFKEKVNNLK